MRERLVVILCAVLGGCLVIQSMGCHRPPIQPTIEIPPNAALLFEPAPGYPAPTDVARSDWPAVDGRIEGPQFGSFYETIYDWQGGPGWGYGYGSGGWNYYNRRVITQRGGTSVR